VRQVTLVHKEVLAQLAALVQLAQQAQQVPLD
jgi:hypothetical protein